MSRQSAHRWRLHCPAYAPVRTIFIYSFMLEAESMVRMEGLGNLLTPWPESASERQPLVS
jgi:hypothetical protein